MEVESHGHVLTLLFFRRLLTVLHSGRTVSRPHQQGAGVPVSHVLASPCHPLLLVVACSQGNHLSGSAVVSHEVLISVSILVSDAEHLFICLLPIRVSSLKKHLFRSYARFSARMFVLLLLGCGGSAFILDVNPFSDT